MTTNRGAAAQTHLDTLRAITTQRAELDGRQYAAVLDARLTGATWAQIGDALGLTPQAVQKRYAAYELAAERDTSRDHLYTAEENAEADRALAVLSASMERTPLSRSPRTVHVWRPARRTRTCSAEGCELREQLRTDAILTNGREPLELCTRHWREYAEQLEASGIRIELTDTQP